MRHVRVRLTAHGREGAIHPMYDVLANAPCVERALALQWNWTVDEVGFLHYVVGDVDSFESAVRDVDLVIDYELEPVGEDAFYAYIHDRMTPALEAFAEQSTAGGLVVVPPMRYREDGSVALSAVGPDEVLEPALEAVPDVMDVEVEAVGGLAGAPQVGARVLSTRQREALAAGLSLGYYDVPRTGSQDDVAGELGCATSTAGEHLRKAEAKLVRSVLRTR